MWRSSPRIGPPRCTTDDPVTNGSTVLVGTVGEIGGSGSVETDDALRRSFAVDAMTRRAVFWKMYSPVASGGSALSSDVGGVVGVLSRVDATQRATTHDIHDGREDDPAARPPPDGATTVTS